ncbi:hypothetical protein [Salmonella phage SSBI34]|nr:hypothetical protein [Salmonella phage SSBI34]
MDFLKSASVWIESYSMSPPVWLTMGILIWVFVVYRVTKGIPKSRKCELSIVGSFIGAFAGFMSRPVLTLLPFLIAVISVGLFIAGIGLLVGFVLEKLNESK